MIEYRNGDIFEQSDLGLIIHQANCMGVFGAGVAKTIKEKYPEAYMADQICTLTPAKKLGYFTYAEYIDKTIVNMYSQLGFGSGKCYTDYIAMRDALIHIRNKFGYIPTHAVPYKIGCGLAGGDWDVVLGTLYRVYEQSKIRLVICRRGELE